ncbi:MAG: DUF4332 domain-containing protein [Candidatus Hodarchaeota archaeon]
MDEVAFLNYLKMQKKSQTTIDQYTRFIKEFNSFLNEQKININQASPKDLKEYYKQLTRDLKQTSVNRHLWALLTFYRHTKNDLMYCVANELLGISYLKNYRLKEFEGVDQNYIEILAAKGITAAYKLLNVGQTKEQRKKLSEENSIPNDTILELVKLSDLARIPGLKKKRARLFYDAGLDTLDKISAYDDSEDLRSDLIHYVKQSKFPGTASTPTEAAHTLLLAKYLERRIEY